MQNALVTIKNNIKNSYIWKLIFEKTSATSNIERIEYSIKLLKIIDNNKRIKIEYAQTIDSTVTARINVHKNDETAHLELFNVKLNITDAIKLISAKADASTIYTKIETDTKLTTKLDKEDLSITKQGNNFNAANQLIQLNSSAQYPSNDGSLISGVAKTIPANTTLLVPSQYATINSALAFLSGKILLGSITIQVADGIYALGTTAISINHPQSKNISIKGNVSTPTNCVLSFTGAVTAISAIDRNNININGFKIVGDRNPNSQGIYISGNSSGSIGANMIVDGFGSGLSVSGCSTVYCSGGFISQNCTNYNYIVRAGSFLSAFNCSSLGYSGTKTNYGFYADGASYAEITNMAITNCLTGVLATTAAYVYAYGVTYTNCTSTSSPSLNTIGNGTSFVQS